MKFSPHISTLEPYLPGKPISELERETGQKNIIKLASNENPLGMSPKVRGAVVEALKDAHRYPDASFFNLIQKLSKLWGLSPQQVSFGHGSNEVLDVLLRTVASAGDEVLAPEKSFIALKICAQAGGLLLKEVPLAGDFEVDVEKIISQISPRTRVLFFANPNNPTGAYFGRSDWMKILENLPPDCLCVVDEAYYEFVRHAEGFTAMDEVRKGRANVAVLRTFSKAYGLAGLRIGALAAHRDLVNHYNRVRNPFNVDHLAQRALLVALEDVDFLAQSKLLVWDGLDFFHGELDRLGIEHWPSQGNFVLMKVPGGATGQVWFQRLLTKGVILRSLEPYGLPFHLRLSVGLKEENEFAIKCIEALRSEK